MEEKLTKDIMPTSKSLFMPVKKKADSPRPRRVLIEANKLLMPGNDGVKRYLTELLDSLAMLEQKLFPEWEIDLYVLGGNPIKLRERREELHRTNTVAGQEKERIEKKIEAIKKRRPFEVRMLQAKEKVRDSLPGWIYQLLIRAYERLPIRYLFLLYRKAVTRRENRALAAIFDRYDLIHIPLPQNFHYLQNVRGKFLLTVHDLTHKHFPGFHTADNAAQAEEGMQQAMRKNAHILAVSEATKADVMQEYPVDADRIHVVYEACNHDQFRPHKGRERLKTVLEKYRLPDCRYFLALSTLEPRKNLLNTIKAFEALVAECADENLALFICGKKGWKTDGLLKKEHVADKNIFFTGFVAEADLPVLYSHALALCYVSFYEGFGLPPLEAMACGATVIYGGNSSMPEVIGDAGLPADPGDAGDIKTQMKILLQDEKMRVLLSEKALMRARQFSWMKAARETLRVYERMM